MEKKKSKFEYLIVFLLILILAIFAVRIVHILQASFNGCGASCPVTGMDSQKAKPVENNI
jgi:uncharacterized integral membrane protein